MDKRKLKWDMSLIAVVLFAVVIVWGLTEGFLRKTADSVQVLQDGELTGTYPLLEDDTIVIPEKEGEGYNLLMISGGKAFLSDADCPDKLCVKQGSISRNGESIICLPHKLVVRITAKEESGLDAVTY